jgi:hypothetical protein
MRWRSERAAFLAAHGDRRAALERNGHDFEVRAHAMWTVEHPIHRRGLDASSFNASRIVAVAILAHNPAALILDDELGLLVAGELATARDGVRFLVMQ